ncbi:MAG TPA: RsmG family class I SAM-dependent methyltransferase, partial [Rhizorhapis sp.]|nr:RsmG family class I SAM-dependent methyltransferase [Rhizorhapis sp.]
MTEEEARAWLKDRFDVPRETWERLDAFVARLLEENQQQNLIAASTAEHVWARHIVDSAQLLLYA